jgi:hypothetical protein
MRIAFVVVVLICALSASARAEIRATLKDPERLSPGRETELTIVLTDPSGAPVTPDMLQEVHTRKIHLLVIDETLSDYQHLHPESHGATGRYTASFRPHAPGNYTAWVDVTPKDGPHQYLPLRLEGGRPCNGPCVNRRLSLSSEAGGLKAYLSFDGPLKQGTPAMGMIHITNEEGRPVRTLEPVMGAFAHIVGFYEDLSGVVHTHPMGMEGEDLSSYGGPNLSFHLEPEKGGFIKFFVQLRQGGRDIFLPFGVGIQ